MRINGDRTLIHFITKSKGNVDYNDYATANFTKKALLCPVNIISVNMLGYTCNAADPKQCALQKKDDTRQATDARLLTYLWSWQYGYPLKSNGQYDTQAFIQLNSIDITDSHFINDDRQLSANHYVLCYKQGSWSVQSAQTNQDPHVVCAKQQAQFAVPPTSYQLNDALYAIAKDSDVDHHASILVNYHYQNGEWIANDGRALVAH